MRFFAENPGRVWSRDQILSRVWGYDYFGGSRTVDVHVRRLRAKLGEERSSWITTVRSVWLPLRIASSADEFGAAELGIQDLGSWI